MVISKGVSCLLQLLLPPLLHALLLAAATASAQSVAKPGCTDRCGNVSIPYPFGIGENCFRPGFDVTCNTTGDGSQRAFIARGNIEIVSISIPDGQLRVKLYTAKQCYNENGAMDQGYAYTYVSESYKFSKTKNSFFAVGCYTLAYIQGVNDMTRFYASGCASFCSSMSSVTDGACDGMGCCETAIPEALSTFNVSFGFKDSTVWDFNPCSHAFLAEKSWYNFSAAHLSRNFTFGEQGRVPVVIDWAIRDNSSWKSACLSENSTYFESDNGYGYRCKCKEGYDGNPYLVDGCQDINECRHPETYPCVGTCKNTLGSYECTCPDGMNGNAKYGPCVEASSNTSFPLSAKLAVGISGGIVILVAVGSFMLMTCQKRKHEREKEMFFDRNGGLKLYEEMISRRVDTVTVFSKTDLERATNNFDDDRVVGSGGRGMVYKGILDDGREVAIKRSKIVDENQKEEFVNEIIILSQINHKNVVRLLGCCLEVEVPILVYEFVSNGTLYNAIHSKNQSAALPLVARIRIATESAEALAYLHSSVTRSIVHGDVKSLNILLDDKGRAKVSDFGASQLVPMDESGFLEFMQGTLGYLDPECLLTHQLTDKSDVYSFGIVLLELITGKKAIYSEGSLEKKSLASSFLMATKENKLLEILDEHVLKDGGMEMLREVAELARQCLSVRGDERLSMKEVAERLQALARYKQHPWGQQGSEEAQSLLGGPTYEYSTGEISVSQSLDSRLLLNIDLGGR